MWIVLFFTLFNLIYSAMCSCQMPIDLFGTIKFHYLIKLEPCQAFFISAEYILKLFSKNGSLQISVKRTWFGTSWSWIWPLPLYNWFKLSGLCFKAWCSSLTMFAYWWALIGLNNFIALLFFVQRLCLIKDVLFHWRLNWAIFECLLEMYTWFIIAFSS